MSKIIIEFVDEHLRSVQNGEISFSRFVELLNEKANESYVKKTDDLKEQDLLLLYVEKELKRELIVNCSSRLIKDIDTEPIKGMIEVANRYIEELNSHMFDLDKINNRIANLKIELT